MLRSKLLEHDNLVRYTEKHKLELVDSSASSSSGTQSPSDPSSVPRRPSQWSESNFLIVTHYSALYKFWLVVSSCFRKKCAKKYVLPRMRGIVY